jgi:endonuclease YncB( thermonuclease family)
MVIKKYRTKQWAAFMIGMSAIGLVSGLAFGKIQPSPQSAEIILEKGETGRVAFNIGGDTFTLESGLTVKLAGIEAPQKSWPDKNIKPQPLSEDASNYVRDLIKGKTVGLYYSADHRDRFGRAIAQVWLLTETGDKDTWIQKNIVEAGFARVYPWQDSEYRVADLYMAEQVARKARRGIWNNRRTKSYYKVRKPDENALAQSVDSVQIIEGIVVASADVKGIVYLNFGADYKTDFTVGIGKSTRKAFERINMDPVQLTGARVRVRGWVEMQNGPMIWLNTPHRLEIIE